MSRAGRAGAAGKRGNVVAMGLMGPEGAQPVGQFRRAFVTAQKKELHTAVSAGDVSGADGIREALEALQPKRLVNCWGVADDDALLGELAGAGVPLVNSIKRALAFGEVEKPSDIPVKRLLDHNAALVLSCDNPSLYRSTLLDEYESAHSDHGIAPEALIQMARRSIELSYLEPERKETMLRNFDLIANSAQSRFMDRN